MARTLAVAAHALCLLGVAAGRTTVLDAQEPRVPLGLCHP
jgi:hypothetical protein